MRAVAIAHFVEGGLLTAWGVSKLFDPARLYKYTEYQNEFLAQHGFAIGLLVVGPLLIVLGLLCLRSSQNEPHGATVFIWEVPPVLAYVMGPPLIMVASAILVAGIPFTAQRGIVIGQLIALFFLSGLFGLGGLFFLHYRRTTILDPDARQLTVRFGNPFTFKEKTFAFSDFSAIGLEIAYGKRGARFYRAMASGDGQKPFLIAVTGSEIQGNLNLKTIASVTGWTLLETPV